MLKFFISLVRIKTNLTGLPVLSSFLFWEATLLCSVTKVEVEWGGSNL